MFSKIFIIICFAIIHIGATPLNDVSSRRNFNQTEDVKVQLISKVSGLALDGTTETLMATLPNESDPGQIWKLYKDNSWVSFMNTVNSYVLGVTGGCEYSGAPTVSPENGTVDQRFLLYSDGTIASACNGFVLQIDTSTTEIQLTEKILCKSISNDDFILKLIL